MKIKKIISAALITTLLPLGTGITAFAEDGLDGLEAVPYLSTSDYEITKNGDYINVDTGSDDTSLLDSIYSKRRSTLPVYYNNDPENLEYVTTPKSQGSLGTCWSFASSSCIETLLMKKDGVSSVDEDDTTYNFSELHAALACSNKFLLDDTYGYVSTGYNDGGNPMLYIMYATRDEIRDDDGDLNVFNGPVSEEEMPYITDTTEIDKITAADMETDKAGKYFPGSLSALHFYSELTDEEKESRNTLIKEFINAYGSVNIAIYSGARLETNYANFGETDDYTLFYEPYCESSNHEVAIVGYDDNFSKDYFIAAGFEDPGMNGAFLVKNSWGTGWGKNSGYFYMSYGSHINNIYAFGDLISRDTYDYEYDYAPFYPISTVVTLSFSDSEGEVVAYGGVYANNFEKQTDKPEELNKVSVYVNHSQTVLKFYVDTDDSDGLNNDMQSLAIKAPSGDSMAYSWYDDEGTSIYVPYAGHYVFELQEPVAIENDFTVAAYAYSYGGMPICCENSYEYSDGSGTFVEHKYIGKSYLGTSIDGTLVTLYDAFHEDDPSIGEDEYKWDLMINAYTSETPVYVTVDGTVYEAEYGSSLSGVLSDANITETVYEETEENSYAPVADTDMELTKHISLYTGSYLHTPSIEMNNYQASDDGEAIRFVGEITDSFDEAVERVVALGFVYSADGGDTTETIVCDNELYEALGDYTAPNNTYLFKSGELTAADYIVAAYVSYVISGETDTVTVYTEEETITIASTSDD
ncbi:MAG: C1 family peptidase [Clostridiales bacterium]|nr:C1 family peptidase [Clostridiales bacterium]